MKKLITFLALLSLSIALLGNSALAASFPQPPVIEADGAILVNADSGAVLFAQNADTAYYPASITKVLTALVVLENCENLDETLTYSERAVTDLEEGATIAAASAGDTMTVREALYCLLLQSAGDSANALAEHVAGSIEEFVKMMNEKTRELGCTNSNFENPTGLNNENQYTTCHDMALILNAAIQNDAFCQIDGALYYKHGPIKQYPDPDDPNNTVYSHHQMMKKNNANYYEGVFAGKTGYTSLAGNTLVTACERDDTTLIAVILNGHNSQYSDTKKLFDYGYNHFENVLVSEFDPAYSSSGTDLSIEGIPMSGDLSVGLDKGSILTLPRSAELSEISTSLNFEIPESAPQNSIAQVSFHYADQIVGQSYLKVQHITEETMPDETLKPLMSVAAAVPETIQVSKNTQQRRTTQASRAVSEDSVISISENNKIHFRVPEPFIKVLKILLLISLVALLIVGIMFLLEYRENHRRAKRRAIRKKLTQDLTASQNVTLDLMVSKKVRKKKKKRRFPYLKR